MPDYSQSVMLALLPTRSDWSRIELPHLTLVWAGTKQDRSPQDFNALVTDALRISQSFSRMRLDVREPDVYGAGTEQNPHVDVLKLHMSGELYIAHRFVKHWNKSEYAYSPHVTVGPQGTIMREQIPIPKTIVFDKIMVAWGNHHISYDLRY